MSFSGNSLRNNYVLGTDCANPPRKLMLFDVAVAGHHAGYIRYLVRHWCDRELPGHLNVVVSPTFMVQHSDVVNIATRCDRKNIYFIPISPEEENSLCSDNFRRDRIRRWFQEWQLICKYASSLEATHCLIMYFDFLKFPLAFGAIPPCSVSGIYFQPKFHYSELSNYVPSIKELLQQWRDKFILLRLVSNPHLKILFCLDPLAVNPINKINSQVKAVYLPDPVQIPNNAEFDLATFKENLGIHPDRQVFLLFGSLKRRKGIHQLLEAILMLQPTLCQKLCLVLLGVPHPIEEKSIIESRIAEVCQSLPIQIIGKYDFISEGDVYKYFLMADVVLATYQRQVGASGILLLAAAARKPVLSSNYGLIGEQVQRYGLGLTVDTTVPAQIADGLTQLLLKSPSSFCDFTKMKSFVEDNSPEEFASIIFQYI